MGTVRRRTGGPAVLATLAVCGMLALTGCRNGDDTAAPDGNPSPAGPAGSAAPAAPSATATSTATPAPSKTGAAAKAPTTATPAAKNPPAPAPTPTCPRATSPDTIALYRWTLGSGSAPRLIVKHGAYGCPVGRFEPSGAETFIPIADTAKITATAPILGSEVRGKPISTHELTSWLTTHPNLGLPFRYHLGADGVIDTLDEIYQK